MPDTPPSLQRPREVEPTSAKPSHPSEWLPRTLPEYPQLSHMRDSWPFKSLILWETLPPLDDEDSVRNRGLSNKELFQGEVGHPGTCAPMVDPILAK